MRVDVDGIGTAATDSYSRLETAMNNDAMRKVTIARRFETVREKARVGTVQA